MNSRDAANVANYETVWLDANRFYEAESRYYESTVADRCKKANPGKVEPSVNVTGMSQSSLANEIAHVRLKIQKCLTSGEGAESGTTLVTRLETLEKNNEAMKHTIEKLTSGMSDVLSRLSSMEKLVRQATNQTTETQQSPKKEESKSNIQNGSSGAADDDDDIDLFGSDEEDDTATKLREERLQAYANKKAKKPALVAKSSVVLDVKPWDDETDMKAMEKAVRAIESDGLVWGASKYVPLAYGIKKLQIIAIVEDEKVSIDWLQETICEIEDLVQSVDIAAFNKL